MVTAILMENALLSQLDGSFLIKYALVQFPAGDVSVIPTNWLLGDDCLWPTHSKNLRTLIIKRVEPGKDWKNFQYKIIETFNTYDDALKAEKEAVATSEDEPDELKRFGKRKIKKKIIPDTLTIPLLSDYDIDSGTVSDIESASSVNLELQQNERVTTPREESAFVTVGTEADNTVIENFTAIPEEKYQLLVDIILKNTTMIQMILNKVNAIDINRSRSLQEEDVLKDDLIRDQLPLNTIDQLLKFEDDLKKQDVTTQLFNKLSLVGGSDFKNFLRRSLPCIFTNELGMQCSWTGQKNNFKIGNTQLMKVIQNAVQATFPTTTGKEFEGMIAEWLRFSKQRKVREEMK